MGADLVWIQHERPDGHRSLWFLAARWITITDATHDMIRVDVPPGWFYLGAEDWHERAFVDLACPTPTPEDLAWLRGAT